MKTRLIILFLRQTKITLFIYLLIKPQRGIKYKISQQWSRLSIFVVNLSLHSNLIYVFACMFDTLDIASSNCLRELFGDSWTKTPQCLVCQIEVSFICLIGIFSDRKTLEFLTVSLSFEDLLPRLTFTCSYFISGTVPLVFI